MSTNGIYAHFHPDEREFVDRAVEWIERAVEQHALRRTDFLDPRTAYILETLANREPDCVVRLDGGDPEAERKRALIGRDYMDLEQEPIGIRLLAIESDDAKFKELVHGDFLGSILGLGIKRDKIGDIHVHGDGSPCHVLVAEEIADYVRLQLQQVHRVHVMTELIPLDRLRTAPKAFEELSSTVASMRLDGIVSDVVRMSRAKILAPIKAGRCKVNWKVEEDPSAQLREGDVVSLQGFGRFKLLEVAGETKKGRIRLKIGKYV